MTKRLTTCALAALFAASASPAFAGGLPDDEGGYKDGGYDEPLQLWTGFYAGVHAGYATGEWDGTTKTTAGEPENDYSGIDGDQSIDGSGHFIGGQIGYNFQRNRVVFGVEGDFSFTNFDGNRTLDTGDTFTTIYVKEHDLELDHFGTARARVGYAMDNGIMPYLTGGFAWAETSGDLSIKYIEGGADDPTPDKESTASADETHMGWTVGGGIESMVSDNWSLKAEYLYVDLGEEDYRFKGKTYTGADFDTDYYESDLNFHSIRLGLNYRIN